MIHNIRFREFVYESENLDELTQAIYNIFPDAEIESEDAEGLMEDKIIILSGVVDKKRQTKAFFNLLLKYFLTTYLTFSIFNSPKLFLCLERNGNF